MYISRLHIDRFDTWRDLVLEDFSDGLNVVYGAERPDRTALARFLRAMLYGFNHEMPERNIPADVGDIGGTLTVKGPFGRQTIHRYANGDQRGRLSVRRDDGSVVTEHQVQNVLPSVPQTVFDSVFTLESSSSTETDRLIDHFSMRGSDLLGIPKEDTGRLAELNERLRGKRRESAVSTLPDESSDQLARRRQSLQQQIESLKTSGQEQRISVERRLRKVDGELAELEEQLEELQDELRTLDARVEAREEERQRKEEEFRDARLRVERERAERREALREIDAQLQRWRCVLQDIEGYGRRLRDTVDLVDASEATVPGQPRRYLQQLENRLDGLQQVVSERGSPSDAERCRCDHWPSTLGPGLQEMRADVYRLCNEFGQWEETARRATKSSELSQLGRCESELRTAISGLTQRRQNLLAEMTQAGDAIRDVLAPTHPDLCTCGEHHHQLEETSPVQDSPSLEDEVLSLLSAEIDELLDRRQEIRGDMAIVEDEIREFQSRRSELEAQRGPKVDVGRVEALRGELRRIEELLHQIAHRRGLASAISHLEQEIRELESRLRQPSVLREASDLLSRLTEGEFQKISSTYERSVCIYDRRGQCLSYQQLKAGARDQVNLSICLALVAAYGREGIRLPVILNGALANVDARSVQATAILLRDFCQRGHQILLLTGDQNVVDHFRGIGVRVRRLPDSEREVPVPAASEELASGLSDAQRQELNRQLNVIADETDRKSEVVEYAAWNAEEFPGELTDRVRPQASTEVRDVSTTDDEAETSDYFLSENSPVQEAPSIDAATAERFRKIGVLLVRDLLHLNVAQAADRLRHAGITANMIGRWQSESLLVCRVPHLRPYDARILVGCGIADPDQLARTEAEELQRRVERFAATSTGQVLLRAGTHDELSRLADWIGAARRKQRQCADGRSHSGSGRGTARSHVKRRGSQPGPESNDRKTETPSTRGPVPRAVVLKMEQNQEQQRFYLNTNESIEQAPSIGPRMAERFEAIGIVTVADFLKVDPDAAAEQLNWRRVSADTIRSWQQQTTLACRIPWLRGHDAQILVACGITDVEDLAKMDAGQLWKIVEPFTATTQCRRIVRNGKLPDFEEVYNWVQWARSARHPQAA